MISVPEDSSPARSISAGGCNGTSNSLVGIPLDENTEVTSPVSNVRANICVSLPPASHVPSAATNGELRTTSFTDMGNFLVDSQPQDAGARVSKWAGWWVQKP